MAGRPSEGDATSERDTDRAAQDVATLIRRLRRRERLRLLGRWIEVAFVPGLASLVALVVLGLCLGGIGHHGMPTSWWPMISVLGGWAAVGLLVAPLGALLRVLARWSMVRVARTADAQDVLAAALAGTTPTLDARGPDHGRLGRWRVRRDPTPYRARPLIPVPCTLTIRAAALLVGAVGVVMSGLAAPAAWSQWSGAPSGGSVLTTLGGMADIWVGLLGGAWLVWWGSRPVAGSWRVEDGTLEVARPCCWRPGARHCFTPMPASLERRRAVPWLRPWPTVVVRSEAGRRFVLADVPGPGLDACAVAALERCTGRSIDG